MKSIKHLSSTRKHCNFKVPIYTLVAALLFLSCSSGHASKGASAPSKISELKEIIKAGQLPAKSELGSYSKELQDVLSSIASDSTKPLGVLYVTKNESSSWQKTYGTAATTELKKAIDQAGAAASASNPYLVLVSPGDYAISTTLNMKNHVSIVGGIAEDGSLNTGETTFDGGGSTQIFSNSDLDKSAALYAVSIRNGWGDYGGGGMVNENSSPSLIRLTFSANTTNGRGGGMYNKSSSSPSLTQVTFSKNTASLGGGMYNDSSSSPNLMQVTFSKNSASAAGGGMYNNNSPLLSLKQLTFFANSATDFGGGMVNNNSSPSLTQVIFTANMALNGGGMFNNNSSSPNLMQVTFSKNSASDSGGGMFNFESSPSLTQVIFFANTTIAGGGMYNSNSYPSLTQVTFSNNSVYANFNGGGMYNVNYRNTGEAGLKIVNSIFWGNKAGKASSQIYIDNSQSDGAIFWGNKADETSSQIDIDNSQSDSTEHLSIHSSIIEGGIAGIRYYNPDFEAGENAVSIGIIATDPSLIDSDMNLYPGGSVSIPTISTSSSAVDKGLYIKKDGSDYYYSENATTWYSTLNRSGLSTVANPPSASVDLTATDIIGHARTGRPDIGAYEAR